ncbi:hypothetical protein CRE_06737 [Caenorhabditis remanei]|uniref:Uncharacterized protein n=1 Tax=Caenorhabditis remanei TaxID=31234 RepID=E3MNV7_CAERE|nr:hypothetical protein CRE_06737 [Caenorhabditis remanei]
MVPTSTILGNIVLRQVFDLNDVKKEEKKRRFGINWSLIAFRPKDRFGLALRVEVPENSEEWSIQGELDVKIASPTGGEWTKFQDFNFNSPENLSILCCSKEADFVKVFADDEKMQVEVTVKDLKISGIDPISFGEDVKTSTDFQLVGEGKKFFVNPDFFSSHSEEVRDFYMIYPKFTFFDLIGRKAAHIQGFLETLSGEDSIDDSTVAGILELAEYFRAPMAFKKCEEFLVKYSGISMKDQLGLAKKYKLDDVKEACLSKLNTVSEITSALPDNLEELDHSVMACLFQKSISLHGQSI